MEMINEPSTGEKYLPSYSFSGAYEGAISHGHARIYNLGWIKSIDSILTRYTVEY